jgi:hypothetical protein
MESNYKEVTEHEKTKKLMNVIKTQVEHAISANLLNQCIKKCNVITTRLEKHASSKKIQKYLDAMIASRDDIIEAKDNVEELGNAIDAELGVNQDADVSADSIFKQIQEEMGLSSVADAPSVGSRRLARQDDDLHTTYTHTSQM